MRRMKFMRKVGRTARAEFYDREPNIREATGGWTGSFAEYDILGQNDALDRADGNLGFGKYLDTGGRR